MYHVTDTVNSNQYHLRMDEVVEAKAGAGSATLSMAKAGAFFADARAVLSGLSAGLHVSRNGKSLERRATCCNRQRLPSTL